MMRDRRVLGLGLLMTVSTAVIAQQVPPAAFVQKVALNIPAQPVADAIGELSQQSGLTIVIESRLGRDVKAPALVGSYSTVEALRRILPRELHTEYLDQKTVAVMSSAPPTAASALSPMRMASAAGADLPSSADVGPSSSEQQDSNFESPGTNPDEDIHKRKLEEVVVTGTHIHAGTDLSAPLVVLDQQTIEQSGYSNSGDLIRSLPENFNGGQNPGVIGTANNGQFSLSGASSPNLHGLGPESTLTLVDGHRLAYDGYLNGVDISMLPLAAIERVDVLTDGASSVYGSDAVAGVVNFVLKKHYDGAETTVRGGGSANGGSTERQFTQLLGKDWRQGNVMLGYEFDKQDALYSNQRAVSSQLETPTSLLPSEKRNSAFLNGRYDFGSNVSGFVQALYTDRKSFNVTTEFAQTSTAYFEVKQTGVTTGINFGLPANWKLSPVVTFSKDRADETFSADPTLAPQFTAYDNTLKAAELQADGPLLQLPAGPVTSALGYGYRKELYTDASTNAERTLNYVFAEMRLPLLAGHRDQTALPTLTLSISARYEDYSDFGSTTNPKIGIAYIPIPGVKLRASWGTSFRAPALLQLYSTRQLYVFPTSFFGVTDGQPPLTLIQFGSNTQLRPEKSHSWTAGVDFSPDFAPALSVSTTYFHLNYKDKIVQPINNFFSALTDPASTHFVIGLPSAALQNQLVANATTFINDSGQDYVPEQVAALVQDQYQNAPQQTIQGIDAQITYKWETKFGRVALAGSGSWLDIHQRLFEGAPSQLVTGTIFNPPKYRFRGGPSWSNNQWSATITLNYVHSELDTSNYPSQAISSWTTTDAQASYRFGDSSNILSGLKLSAAVQNAFNREPPKVSTESTTSLPGVGYDSTNASALGRFISVYVTKAW